MARQTAFVYDDALSRHSLGASHPMKPERLRYTYETLDAYGAFDAPSSSVVKPRMAAEQELDCGRFAPRGSPQQRRRPIEVFRIDTCVSGEQDFNDVIETVETCHHQSRRTVVIRGIDISPKLKQCPE